MNDDSLEFPAIKWGDTDTSDEWSTMEELREAVWRVRDTHRPSTHTHGDILCIECNKQYPCRTIKAISLIKD